MMTKVGGGTSFLLLYIFGLCWGGGGEERGLCLLLCKLFLVHSCCGLFFES